jgi:ABC-type multidrug transport system ATPase subunit
LRTSLKADMRFPVVKKTQFQRAHNCNKNISAHNNTNNNNNITITIMDHDDSNNQIELNEIQQEDAELSSSSTSTSTTNEQQVIKQQQQDEEISTPEIIYDSLPSQEQQQQQYFDKIQPIIIKTPGTNKDRPPIQLEWKDVAFRVKVPARPAPDATKTQRFKAKFQKDTKTILYPMSGHVSPGSVLAIMGPSGAGKTSLLNILAQRVKQTEGTITVNGQDVGKSFRALSAFVQQDDVMMGNLTVREMLRYAALLRLDSKIPLKVKMQKIDDILDELGLTKCADTVIGVPGMKKGISGGERKRLSIALELLTEPSILFLDEPTTGLDAKTALNVVETITKIARRGRAVIMTIHQPRSDIFKIFDKLLLLAKGKVAYFGDASRAASYFSSLKPIDPENPDMFTCPDEYNPADYFIDLITESTGAGDEKAKDDARIHYILDEYEKSFTYVQPHLDAKLDSDLSRFSTYKSSWLAQFFVILSRSFLNIMRDKVLTFSRLFQTIVMALIVGLIFFRLGWEQKNVSDRSGVLFFIMLNSSMGSMFASMSVFLSAEKPVFLRERGSKTYHVSSYYWAKAVAELPSQIFFPLLNGVICYWMVRLNPAFDRFAMFLFILVLQSMCAQSLGTLIGSLAPNSDVANAIAPLLVTILMLFGGLYINVENIPVYLIWIYWTSMFHFTYEAFILNEFSGQTFRCPAEPETCVYPTGESVIESMSMTGRASQIWIDIALLIGVNIAYKILAFLALRFIQKPKGG